jgi:hypothetical protein
MQRLRIRLKIVCRFPQLADFTPFILLKITERIQFVFYSGKNAYGTLFFHIFRCLNLF